MLNANAAAKAENYKEMSQVVPKYAVSFSHCFHHNAKGGWFLQTAHAADCLIYPLLP